MGEPSKMNTVRRRPGKAGGKAASHPPKDTATHGVFQLGMAAAIALSWTMVSTLIILLNKRILKDLKFSYPMSVSSMGLVVSSLLSYLICRASSRPTPKCMTLRVWLTHIVPMGFFAAGTMTAGNTAYLYLGVGFIQMLKALSPIFTMLALFSCGMEQPSWGLVSSVSVIAAGMCLATYGEMNISIAGLALVLVAELTEAGRLVLAQSVLKGLSFGTFEGLMFMAPATFAWLFGAACFTEVPRMLSTGDLAIVKQHPLAFLGSACLGFAVVSLSYATIKLTNSLTLKVLGNLRNVVTILVAVFVFHEVVTATQAVGYAISLVGFSWYSYITMKQQPS